MEFQAHVTIILYRNRLGSSFPKCLWKMEDLFNNHADHSCDSWMVPVLNPGVQFNGIIGLCKKKYIYIYIYSTHTNVQSMLVQKGSLGLFGIFTFQWDSSIGNFRIIEPFDMQRICTESFLQGQAFLRVYPLHWSASMLPPTVAWLQPLTEMWALAWSYQKGSLHTQFAKRKGSSAVVGGIW